MTQHGSTRSPASSRRTRGARLGAATLPLLAACVPAQPVTVASLAGSRQLVTVAYPTAQTVRATATGRDTVLTAVTHVVGWPADVRGDTLRLQLSRWRADGRTHAMRAADHVVAVPPSAGATIVPGEQTGEGYSLVTTGALVGLLVGAGLVAYVLGS